MCRSLILLKLQVFSLKLHGDEALVQMLCCEFCEIFWNTYFPEHLRGMISKVSEDALENYLFDQIMRVIYANIFNNPLTPTFH